MIRSRRSGKADRADERRIDAERTDRVRRTALEMLSWGIGSVLALGISVLIGALLDSAFAGGIAFFFMLGVALLVAVRIFMPASTGSARAAPRPRASPRPSGPPMHNLIKVPLFALLLLALWVGTWACLPACSGGLSLFLLLAVTVTQIVRHSVPLRYGVLVVLLFWCSALVLLLWPAAGYPENVGWGTMTVGPIVHLCIQAAVYIDTD